MFWFSYDFFGVVTCFSGVVSPSGWINVFFSFFLCVKQHFFSTVLRLRLILYFRIHRNHFQLHVPINPACWTPYHLCLVYFWCPWECKAISDNNISLSLNSFGILYPTILNLPSFRLRFSFFSFFIWNHSLNSIEWNLHLLPWNLLNANEQTNSLLLLFRSFFSMTCK